MYYTLLTYLINFCILYYTSEKIVILPLFNFFSEVFGIFNFLVDHALLSEILLLMHTLLFEDFLIVHALK